MLDLLKRCSSLALLLLVAGVQAACVADEGTTGDEEDLTSVTARTRALTIEGYVYVEPTASASQILASVRKQNESGFGALREASISANKIVVTAK